ncbi:MAG: hypothetical protein Q4B59_00850 [Lachnospiraceae bacterium]|nr:hypothetical protein [Lachnospiraceae bacterium]
MKTGYKRIGTLGAAFLLSVSLAAGAAAAQAQAQTEEQSALVTESMTSEREKAQQEFLDIFTQRFAFEGEGTREKPFLINDYEDLCRLRDSVNVGVTYETVCFRQTAPIEMEDENWTPIGDRSEQLVFKGTYDGGGFGLSGVCIDTEKAALFGYLDGTVQNLGIESGLIRGTDAAAIAASAGSQSKIINCYNLAEIRGENSAAGIVTDSSGSLLYCRNLGKLEAGTEETFVAGICHKGSASIRDCSAARQQQNVTPAFFTGELIHVSSTDSDEQMERSIQSGYGNWADYRKLELVQLSDLVQMNCQEGRLFFEGDGPEKVFLSESRIGDLPPLCLGGCALLVLILVAWKTLSSGKMSEKTEAKSEAGAKKDQKKSGKAAGLKRTEEKGSAETVTAGSGTADGSEKTDGSEKAARRRLRICQAAGCVLTLTLTFGGFTAICSVMKNKNRDGIVNYKHFYEQEAGSTDVLFLGSSKMGMNIDGETLWTRYGLTSYDLWAGYQTFWSTYDFLTEAIRVSKPRVAVLDVSAFSYGSDYSTGHKKILNTFGLKMGPAKLQAVLHSCEAEELSDYLLEFPLFHERYANLTETDFKEPAIHFNMGYNSRYGRKDIAYDLSGLEDLSMRAPDEKELYYLQKIIDLCKEEEIELLLIKTQSPTWSKEKGLYNFTRWFAGENDVPYLDLNELQEETGFTSQDFMPDAVHLNMYGGRKNAEYLGRYILENFQVDTEKTETLQDKWNETAAIITNSFIRVIDDNEDYFDELRRDKKTVIAVPYGMNGKKTKSYRRLFDQLVGTEYECWDKADYCYGEEEQRTFQLGSTELTVTKEYDQMIIDVKNDKKVTMTESGTAIIVYDEVTDRLVDIALFTESKDYKIVHGY